MPASASRVLQNLFKAAFVIGVLLVALLGLLVAWWVALLFAGAWVLFSSVRRLLHGGGRNSAPRAAATVIEGEYRVEHHPMAEHDPKAEHDPQAESSPGVAGPGGGRPRD